jgi:hypothetical protein
MRATSCHILDGKTNPLKNNIHRPKRHSITMHDPRKHIELIEKDYDYEYMMPNLYTYIELILSIIY